jgi:hypothetical protein
MGSSFSRFESAQIACIGPLAKHSSQQDRFPMVVQELPLPRGERAEIHDAIHLDSHPVQGTLVCDGRRNQDAGIFKANEPAIRPRGNQ